MKHIKRYNEGLHSKKTNDIKEFCQDCLVYLIDDGFEVSVTEMGFNGYNICWLCKPDGHRKIEFTWKDIKESFIPLLELINKKYSMPDLNNLGQFVRVVDTNYRKDYELSLFVNDTFDNNLVMESIGFILE